MGLVGLVELVGLVGLVDAVDFFLAGTSATVAMNAGGYVPVHVSTVVIGPALVLIRF